MTINLDDNGKIEKLSELIQVFMKKLDLMNETQNQLIAQWYDLDRCHELRGGGSVVTFKKVRWYQPKGGIPDAIVQGRHVWSKETVKEWLSYTDENLPDYHKKYMTGARNPKGGN